ncbi:MAG: alpha/beta family hydrolase [Pseudomonadota bacterium]
MRRETIEREVDIPLDAATHRGDLGLPPGAGGLVIFAHGSGSSRLSSRNRFVAEALRRAGLGTLLFDLLTETEDRDYERRFDIDLLTHRLLAATAWARHQPELKELMYGYFGASTGAAAALKAAAELGDTIDAVVSRGGRPDLAIESLARVTAPTLLIVGSRDEDVIELNRKAYARLTGVAELEIVPGATHLFEEPGTLEEVARLASGWFRRYLRIPAPVT